MKDPFESSINCLLTEEKNLKNPKSFKKFKGILDYSQTIDNVYKNMQDYNPTKKRRLLIVFDNITADMEFHKKLSQKVTEFFLRGRKLNISLVSQSYFKIPKTVRRNATHYFIVKITNKRKIQEIASNHLSDIGFNDFMKLYKEYTKEPYSFLVNNTTLSSDKPLRFRKNLL